MTGPQFAAAHTARLRKNGFTILEGIMDRRTIDRVSRDLDPHFATAPLSQGVFSGEDTRRFGRLPVRSSATHALIEHAGILALVEEMLGPWCDRFVLNLTQAIQLEAGSIEQVPHRDQDMWTLSRHLPPASGIELLVNVMWPLTDFTDENGATHIWPGSHRDPHKLILDPDLAVKAQMKPGSALVFLGSTLHAAGANRAQTPRRGIIISYCLGWLKPYEIPWLAYPPEIARTFTKTLAALAGYKIHRPNLGVFEGRCPSALLDGTHCGGAIDALLPDQEHLITAWRNGEITHLDVLTGNAAQ